MSGCCCEPKNIESIKDYKEFKKLLRVRSNILIAFTNSSSPAQASLRSATNVIFETANLAVGKAVVTLVDCLDKYGKKLCKKLKVVPNPVVIKHYQGGEYHKDYDRKMTTKSMYRFLLDPMGDIPWDEDPSSRNVVHLEGKNALKKVLAQGKPTLVMFHAPWCDHCKRLKPHYSAAADELQGKTILAAIDATLEGNDVVAKLYKVEGFPTLEYFEGGKHKIRYVGENSKDRILSWLENPTAVPAQTEPAEEELPWPDTVSDVVHLTDDNFERFIVKHKSVLVMFYAPWCVHCKQAKPKYMSAAARLKKDSVEGVLAAVDATTNKKLAEKYKIEGFPTIIFFKNGKYLWNINERTEQGFYDFMKNPTEPPKSELPWKQEPGHVLHLDISNFKSELKKKKSALVMFYAPWCGHCKRAKPFFSEAAEKLSHDVRVAFAAVDCTTESVLCENYGVKGFPTFLHFTYGKKPEHYGGAISANALADAATIEPVAKAREGSVDKETRILTKKHESEFKKVASVKENDLLKTKTENVKVEKAKKELKTPVSETDEKRVVQESKRGRDSIETKTDKSEL